MCCHQQNPLISWDSSIWKESLKAISSVDWGQDLTTFKIKLKSPSFSQLLTAPILKIMCTLMEIYSTWVWPVYLRLIKMLFCKKDFISNKIYISFPWAVFLEIETDAWILINRFAHSETWHGFSCGKCPLPSHLHSTLPNPTPGISTSAW